MRRLKHTPELVAWGEAYYDEETGTKWFSESIYPLHEQHSINMLDMCELPEGQYILKTSYYLPDDSIYISGREFNVDSKFITDMHYDSGGIYESFNGEMLVFTVSYWIDGDLNRPVVSVYSDIQGPGENEDGNLTYKIWRIA